MFLGVNTRLKNLNTRGQAPTHTHTHTCAPNTQIRHMSDRAKSLYTQWLLRSADGILQNFPQQRFSSATQNTCQQILIRPKRVEEEDLLDRFATSSYCISVRWKLPEGPRWMLSRYFFLFFSLVVFSTTNFDQREFAFKLEDWCSGCSRTDLAAGQLMMQDG